MDAEGDRVGVSVGASEGVVDTEGFGSGVIDAEGVIDGVAPGEGAASQ